MRISDWSSDVCSSDLAWSMVMAELGLGQAKTQSQKDNQKKTRATNANPVRGDGKGTDNTKPNHTPTLSATLPNGGQRSEERRVGKEGGRTCRSWWSPSH